MVNVDYLGIFLHVTLQAVFSAVSLRHNGGTVAGIPKCGIIKVRRCVSPLRAENDRDIST